MTLTFSTDNATFILSDLLLRRCSATRLRLRTKTSFKARWQIHLQVPMKMMICFPTMFQNLKQQVILISTRKSSCVNARGIPTAAYQVLHLLPEAGSPLAGGTPRPGPMGGGQGYLRWGTPLAGGYPPARSDGGYPRWGTPLVGVPPSQVWRGAYLRGLPPCRWGTPQPGLMGSTPWPDPMGGGGTSWQVG